MQAEADALVPAASDSLLTHQSQVNLTVAMIFGNDNCNEKQENEMALAIGEVQKSSDEGSNKLCHEITTTLDILCQEQEAAATVKALEREFALALLGLYTDEVPTEQEIKQMVQCLSLKHNPDKDGDKDQFNMITAAHKTLLEGIANRKPKDTWWYISADHRTLGPYSKVRAVDRSRTVSPDTWFWTKNNGQEETSWH